VVIWTVAGVSAARERPASLAEQKFFGKLRLDGNVARIRRDSRDCSSPSVVRRSIAALRDAERKTGF